MNLKTPSKTPLDKPENTTNSEHQLPLNLNPEQTGQRSIEWTAGLFEGEGWLCRNGRYSWELAIEMTDKDVIEEFHRVMGKGMVYLDYNKPSRIKLGRTKLLNKWRSGNREELYSLIKSLYPYFGSRRRSKCDEFFEWYESKQK